MRTLHLLALIVAVSLSLALAACAGWPNLLPQAAPASAPLPLEDRPVPPALAPVPTPTPRPWSQTDNYLILGSDQRPGDGGWRTDSIILAAVDHAGQRVGLLSVPRDLYVDIPGIGETRINTADFLGEKNKYPGGGPALLRRVLTQTLGIDAPHYVRIKMQVFEELVDAFGGVTVTLPCPFLEAAPDGSSGTGLVEWSLPAGDVWLNGRDARRFATYRYYSNDFDRARRQQILLWALRERAFQIDLLSRLPQLWSAYQNSVQTDLGFADILRLAQIALRLRPENVHGLTFDFSLVESFTTESGAHVLRVRDPEAPHAWLATLFAGPPVKPAAAPDQACPPPRRRSLASVSSNDAAALSNTAEITSTTPTGAEPPTGDDAAASDASAPTTENAAP